jgi:hypothetical protein
MSIKTQLRLAASRKGRILFHIIGLAMDHKFALHFKGVWREVTLQGKSNPFVVSA